MTAAPCSADSGVAASLNNPAKKPLSQERCASENGALVGMISILGGGVIWFMRRSPRPRAYEVLRRRGGEQRSERFRMGRRDARDRLSAASQPSAVRPRP